MWSLNHKLLHLYHALSLPFVLTPFRVLKIVSLALLATAATVIQWIVLWLLNHKLLHLHHAIFYSLLSGLKNNLSCSACNIAAASPAVQNTEHEGAWRRWRFYFNDCYVLHQTTPDYTNWIQISSLEEKIRHHLFQGNYIF